MYLSGKDGDVYGGAAVSTRTKSVCQFCDFASLLKPDGVNWI
jgi:hypothetical protein